MPHLVIYYTANLDRQTDMNSFCRTLADTMMGILDDEGQPVFPTGGIRVLAYPAPYYAISDGGAAGRAKGGSGDYGFMYLNLRMGRGRSAATHERTGQILTQAVKHHLADLFASNHMGITLQIDEGHEVFDHKHSNLHSLFSKK